MTRVMSVATAAVFSGLTAHPAVAQLPKATPPQAQQPGPTFVAPGDKPFKGIFGAPATQLPLQGIAKLPAQYVVCGLTVIRVDPKLDAGMLVRPKPAQTVAPKARIIEPKICR
jgi:hypothetical protein